MTPEIESLAQQLIEAASFAPGWVKGDPISEELMAAWTNVATPANITAVILAFREELKQARRDALSNAAGLADKMALAAAQILEKSHNEDASVQFDTAREIADAIRALMEKPE